MNFPDDATLIARGKYSTLGRERHAQLERVQKICTTVIGTANHILRDCEQKPPVDASHLKLLDSCLKNAQDGRERLVTICEEMALLKPEAWPE